LKTNKRTSILLTYFYCIMVTNMFRPVKWQSSGWFLWEQEENCNYSFLNHSTILQLELRFKKHICYITSNNTQLADTIHILHNIHKYEPMETAITLLHSEIKKQMYTLENYYIQFFHQHNTIIKEQTWGKKNPLFKLTYNIHVHHASA
jgi:hypothetical protein